MGSRIIIIFIALSTYYRLCGRTSCRSMVPPPSVSKRSNISLIWAACSYVERSNIPTTVKSEVCWTQAGRPNSLVLNFPFPDMLTWIFNMDRTWIFNMDRQADREVRGKRQKKSFTSLPTKVGITDSCDWHGPWTIFNYSEMALEVSLKNRPSWFFSYTDITVSWQLWTGIQPPTRLTRAWDAESSILWPDDRARSGNEGWRLGRSSKTRAIFLMIRFQ